MEILEKIKKLTLDSLFPIKCFLCGIEGEWICSNCLTNIELAPFQVCPRCEKIITESGKLCHNCKKFSLPKKTADFPLDRLIIASGYKKNNIASIIHAYKYRSIRDLSEPLGKIMVCALMNSGITLPNIIIPVPLHPRRLRSRGFNQSEELAHFLSKNLTPGFIIPTHQNLLVRKKNTAPQMEIRSYKARKENVKNIFGLSKKINLRNKKILLIDDVATTGATLIECARVLKQNGAKEISAAVIARQSFS